MRSSASTRHELLGHPKVGASWEGFVIEQVVGRLKASARDCYFWALHTGAELDLLVVQGAQRRGYEIKLTDSPSVTPSMSSALTNLKLDSLDVIHAGAETFQLGRKIRAVAMRDLVNPRVHL